MKVGIAMFPSVDAPGSRSMIAGIEDDVFDRLAQLQDHTNNHPSSRPTVPIRTADARTSAGPRRASGVRVGQRIPVSSPIIRGSLRRPTRGSVAVHHR